MRLDRYLISQLAKSTLFNSTIVIIVLLGLQVLRLSDMIIRFDLELVSVVNMLGGLCLSFTPIVVPMAFLFAALNTFGRMSTDREMIALAAMGRSHRRILAPCLAFGVAMCVASVLISFYVGPFGNRRFERSIDEAFKRRVANVLRSGTFSEGFLGMVVFVDKVDPAMKNLERVFIHDETSFRDQVSISAKTGTWTQSVDEGIGTLGLHDGVVVSQVPAKKIVRRIHFTEYDIHADFSRPEGSSRNSPPSLDASELFGRRSEPPEPGSDLRAIWTEIARRFAVSVACLLFVPLAYCLSVDNSRTAQSRSVFLGLLIVTAYWTVYFTLYTWVLRTPWNFAIESEPLSWAVMWVPNMVVLGVTAFFFRRRLAFR